MVFVHETTRVLLARFLLIPSDDDLTLSMIRFVLVSLSGIFFGTSPEGSIWGVSGLVGMPREDSNRLAVFVWSDCTVVGVFVCAGGVICSTVLVALCLDLGRCLYS